MKFRSFLLSCVSTLHHVRRSLKYFRSRSQQCVNIKLKKTFFVVVASGYEKKKNPSCRFKCVFVVLMYLIKVDTFFRFISFHSMNEWFNLQVVSCWKKKNFTSGDGRGVEVKSGIVAVYRFTGLSWEAFLSKIPAARIAIRCAPKSVTRSLF